MTNNCSIHLWPYSTARTNAHVYSLSTANPFANCKPADAKTAEPNILICQEYGLCSCHCPTCLQLVRTVESVIVVHSDSVSDSATKQNFKTLKISPLTLQADWQRHTLQPPFPCTKPKGHSNWQSVEHESSSTVRYNQGIRYHQGFRYHQGTTKVLKTTKVQPRY